MSSANSRYLLVGDPHATPDSLDDIWQLMGYVNDVARKTGSTVLILGDLHDTHAVVRVEVLACWREVFGYLKRTGISTVALVGNHDYAGEGASEHALMAYDGIVDVIDRPTVRDGLLFVPYMPDQAAFVRVCESYPDVKTVICHQTFDGSQYENGVYAPDGIDPASLPQEQIISGHIHTPQTYGKVWYPGAPRWRTLSDANVSRAFWYVEFGSEGTVVAKQPYDTGFVCRQIRYAIDTPEAPVTEALDPRHDWRVDIKGPAAWIEHRKGILAGPGVRVRTFKTETRAPTVRESEGVALAFGKYLGAYKPRYGTSTDVLQEMAKERLHVT